MSLPGAPRDIEFGYVMVSMHMLKAGCMAWVALMVLGLGPDSSAGAIYKCKVQGTVTYQSSPCPAAEPLQRPTLAQLNAERQKKLREQALEKAAQGSGLAAASAITSPAPVRPVATAPVAAAIGETVQTFRCDGRTRCNQMRSCQEATYFLNHCPGVKMDGDSDGIPCEGQWCGDS